jgi:hypothetical protein
MIEILECMQLVYEMQEYYSELLYWLYNDKKECNWTTFVKLLT